MSGREVLGLLAFAGLVAFAAVLAVAETSLTHLGRARAARLAEDGDPRAAELARLLEHRERVLNPILLVLLACHLAAATIVAVLAADRWGPAGVIVSFVVEAIVIFVLAEAVPKTYALLATERAALRVTPLVKAIAFLAPLRWATRLLVGAANVIIPGRRYRRRRTSTDREHDRVR
jgi:Mg2+/Co2+ transporter CorB